MLYGLNPIAYRGRGFLSYTIYINCHFESPFPRASKRRDFQFNSPIRFRVIHENSSGKVESKGLTEIKTKERFLHPEPVRMKLTSIRERKMITPILQAILTSGF